MRGAVTSAPGPVGVCRIDWTKPMAASDRGHCRFWGPASDRRRQHEARCAAQERGAFRSAAKVWVNLRKIEGGIQQLPEYVAILLVVEPVVTNGT